MKSFKQYITEVFDKPYKWRGGRLAKGVIAPNNDGIPEDYAFKTSDGGLIELTASHFWMPAGEKLSFMTAEKEGHAVGIEFVKRKHKGTHKDRSTYGMTGEGDAMRILATVLDIINAIIKKHEPAMLYFSGDKGGRGIERTGESGRVGAYTAIVKRFAGKAGYKSVTKEYSDKVNFQLVKK
jgi:hypothetical protein|tara:strand:+ start:2102 stop:2644 length:543 start_codon:yes stop_codon:yes gene_type:complete